MEDKERSYYSYDAKNRTIIDAQNDIKRSDFKPFACHESEFIKFFFNQFTQKFLIEISLSPTANFSVLMDFPGFVRFINNYLSGIASLKPNLIPEA
jgi:basic membrane lipoprotein Med (substrate-binding protein (PBP1-ABC) superfamily)